MFDVVQHDQPLAMFSRQYTTRNRSVATRYSNSSTAVTSTSMSNPASIFRHLSTSKTRSSPTFTRTLSRFWLQVPEVLGEERDGGALKFSDLFSL